MLMIPRLRFFPLKFCAGFCVPAYFAGHWINVTDATGAPKGSWRIGTISNKAVTLVPNGSETISIQPGDYWRHIGRNCGNRAAASAHG